MHEPADALRCPLRAATNLAILRHAREHLTCVPNRVLIPCALSHVTRSLLEDSGGFEGVVSVHSIKAQPCCFMVVQVLA